MGSNKVDDNFEGLCVKCESKLYREIVRGRHFRELMAEAEELGMSLMDTRIATDERLVYFIGLKTGVIFNNDIVYLPHDKTKGVE